MKENPLMLFRLVLITAVLSIAVGNYSVSYYKNREAMKMKWLTSIRSKTMPGHFKQVHRKPSMIHRNHIFKDFFKNSKKYFSGLKYKPQGYVRLL